MNFLSNEFKRYIGLSIDEDLEFATNVAAIAHAKQKRDEKWSDKLAAQQIREAERRDSIHLYYSNIFMSLVGKAKRAKRKYSDLEKQGQLAKARGMSMTVTVGHKNDGA